MDKISKRLEGGLFFGVKCNRLLEYWKGTIMDKRFFEKRCHYSIRKFAIGAASVMIGASIFGLQVAQAAETETASPSEETIHQVQPLDKLPDEVAAADRKSVV